MEKTLKDKLQQLEKLQNCQRDIKLFNLICKHYGCDLVVGKPYKIGLRENIYQDKIVYWVLGWYQDWGLHRLYFIDELNEVNNREEKDGNKWNTLFDNIKEIVPLINNK